MYAIIATGGKQYKVSEGDIIPLKSLELMLVRRLLLISISSIRRRYEGWKPNSSRSNC